MTKEDFINTVSKRVADFLEYLILLFGADDLKKIIDEYPKRKQIRGIKHWIEKKQ